MSKLLSTTKVETLKEMALQGITPAEICKNLGCSISTVHYYKDKFRKAEGLRFPTLKGKRPLPTHPFSQHPAPAPHAVSAPGRKDTEPTNQPLMMIVNGVSIQLAPGLRSIEMQGVKSIEIQNGSVQVNF